MASFVLPYFELMSVARVQDERGGGFRMLWPPALLDTLCWT